MERHQHRLFSRISMNWRGRPLTSHEVIINTITATTTRTGLRVRAELDTRCYPAGEAISDAQMTALAITRHHWHGEWNYTLHPEHPGHATATEATPQQPGSCDLSRLSHPAITGISATEWDDLLIRLTVPREAQREAALHNRRGGSRRLPPGPGRRPRLTLAGRLLATVLDQRFSTPQPVIAGLFGVKRMTINNAVRETRQLLTQIRRAIQPAGTQLATLADLADHAARAGLDLTEEIKVAC